MNKKKIQTSEDAAFLRAHAEVTEHRRELPESLSESSITALVSGKKQKVNKRKVIRRTVAGVLAACLVVCCFTVYDYAVFRPVNITAERGGMQYAKSHGEIVDLINDYAKLRAAGGVVSDLKGISLRGGRKATSVVDEAIAEEIAVGSDFFYTADSFVSSRVSAGDYAKPKDDGTEPFTVAASAVSAAEQTAETYDMKSSYSETNVRVKGIAEADVIKTDGEYIYVLTLYDEIRIFKAEKDGSVTPVSTVRAYTDAAEEGSHVTVYDFYVIGDLLAVNVTKYIYGETMSETCGCVIYELGDRTAPRLVRTVMQDGYYVSSRVTDGKLILISDFSPMSYFDGKATVENSIPGTYCDAEEKAYVPAEDIAVVNAECPDSYVVVTKFDLTDLSSAPATVALFGGGSETYCTDETLYVVTTSYCPVGSGTLRTAFGAWEIAGKRETAVLKFDITGSAPEFKALGTVDGYVLNSFSMDEYNGYLRVALTRENDNAIAVLNGDLETVAVLDGIGNGEIIKSVRFMGDTAYVVTFVQTDPLFVIDLSDPTAPRVTGEVKLPGFSSYLHPIPGGYLLGVGTDGTETGVNGNSKISLFDVSDPTAPKEADSLVFADSWLQTEYKAFVSVYDGSFIIPIEGYQWIAHDDGVNYSAETVAGWGAVRVAVENGKLVLKNKYLSSEGEGYGSENRAVFIGDHVYTVDMAPFVITYDMDSGERLFCGDFYSSANDDDPYGETVSGSAGTVEVLTEVFSAAEGETTAGFDPAEATATEVIPAAVTQTEPPYDPASSGE